MSNQREFPATSYRIPRYVKLCFHITWFSLLSAWPISPAMGQLPDYSIRKFGLEHGLEYGIKKIVQDAHGFIWLMGSLNLQRFDGKNTDVWFKGDRMHSFLVDSEGDVWVTTENGIFQFNYQNRQFSQIAIEADDTSVKIVFEPVEGQLFCIGTSGIYLYDEVLQRFVLSDAPLHQLKSKAQVSFSKFSHYKHILYYCSKDTVWHHDMKTGEFSKTAFSQIMNVLALSEEEIIVSTWEHKSWYYNFSTNRQYRLSMPGEDSLLFIPSTVAMDKNSYYLATSKGIASYKPGTNRLHRIYLSFEGKPVPIQRYEALYKGAEDLVWVGTRSNLLSFNPLGTRINFIQSSAKDPRLQFSHNVRNFAEDEQGNLWLATGNGLTCWNTKLNQFSTIAAEENAIDRLNHASIRGLAYDGTHLIIGQTNKGIWLYNPKTKVFKRPAFENNEKGRLLRGKIERSFIHQVTTLQNGNHIITAGDNGAAYLMHRDTYMLETIDFPKAKPHVEFSYEDTRGNIYIGTIHDGLYCFDASLNYQYQVKESLKKPWITSLLELDTGYYMGTEKGLYFFSENSDRVTVKKVIPELEEYPIKTLFEDAKNTLWIVTESKLHQYFPTTGYLNTYGYSENVRGDFFHPNSYIRKSNGQVFIGSINGILYFYPEKIKLYSDQLQPYIRNVNINQFTDSTDYFEYITHLKYHQNTLNIGFSTPYYGNTDDITYKYQLTKEGEWFNHGSQPGITLWGLPPGDYQFRLAATLSDNVWHASEDRFRFTILPPFWKTRWFTLGMLVLGCAILCSLFIYFQQRLKTEKLLNVFVTSLYGHNNVDDILWNTARNFVQKLGFTNCTIYQVDKKKNVLLQKATISNENPYNKDIINEIPMNEGMAGVVAKSGRAKHIKSRRKGFGETVNEKRVWAEIALPIWVEEEVFGVINLEGPKINFYKHNPLRLLEKIAGICADRIRKYLTEEKLRGKIARDLHDEMGSTLTSIHIISKMTEQDLQENVAAKKQLTRIKSHASDMMEKMSDMVWVVNPANDSLDKLTYKIREYAAEVLELRNISLSFQEIEDARYVKLNPEERKNIYLIAKETLNNTVKYSNASKVNITFKEENSTLEMCISDNGIGYDPNIAYSGNGIKNMCARSEEINATLQIETSPGNGVSVLFYLNVKKTSAL